MAVGTRGAVEALPKVVRVRAETHPRWPWGKIDAVNGYGNQHRRQAGDALREAFPDLGRFWATWYARRSEYVLRRPDGTVFRVTSCSGWDQGDPFPPAGYSVGLAPALEAARARIRAALPEAQARDVVILAYLDDVVFTAPPEAFYEVHDILRAELPQVGH